MSKMMQIGLGDEPQPEPLPQLHGDGRYLDGERYRRALLELKHICDPPMLFAPCVTPGETRYRPGLDAMYKCNECNTLWVMRHRQVGGGHYPGKGLYWRRVHWWEFTKKKIFAEETAFKYDVVDATDLPQIMPKAPAGRSGISPSPNGSR